MTAVPIRDTPFATWIDPDAWMESMKGSKWKSLLQEESAIIEKTISKPAIQKRLGAFEAAYRSVQEKSSSIQIVCGPINIHWISTFFKVWNFQGSDTKHTCRDIICSDSMVWCTEDIGDGAELLELQAWSITDQTKPKWKKGPVGPEIALLGSKLYYLGVENKLISHTLWSCDAATGKQERCVYTEKIKTINLSLERHGDGRVKLIRDNSQDIDVIEILPSRSFLRRSTKYPIPITWVLPLIRDYGIEFAWQSQGILVLKQHGSYSVWKCKPHKAPKKLLQIKAGQILFDPYAVSAGTVPTKVFVSQPDTGIVEYMYNGNTLQLVRPILPSGLTSQRFHTKSNDDTIVHGILTYKTNTIPTNLLMIGYGAYGMQTSIGFVKSRWAPLVEAGWAIGYTFLRGGGDHTETWAKIGRLEGRTHTVDDFIALVKFAQAYLQIASSRTVLYGRSAGGLLMGESLRRYPNGSLMKAVYAEVPYVDELRTTSNPDLPLTTIETNEFGNSMLRLKDFIDIGLLSPADSATVLQAPNVLVLARSAIHDSQVFTYESVKWIRRLRANQTEKGAPKLCIIEKDQGHFTPPDATIKQWSLDCAILDAWIEKEL